MPNKKQTNARKGTKWSARSADRVEVDGCSDDTNSNSNHSQPPPSAKKGKISLSDETKTLNKIKTRNVTRSTTDCGKAGGEPSGVNSVQVAKQPSKQKQTGEEEPNDVESAQFEEDGDVVHMEINDGGAAATEFKSDYDSDESESEEEEDLADDQTEPDYDDVEHNSFTDEGTTVSETKSEGGAVSSQQNNRARKTKQNKKAKDLQRLSVEAKLDSLSSSLEMMKDLFMQSGIMSNKADTKEDDGAGPSTSRQQTGKDGFSN